MTAVGTAMIATQLVTFFMIRFIRWPLDGQVRLHGRGNQVAQRLGPLGCPQDMVVDVLVVGRHRLTDGGQVTAQQRVQ